MPLNRQYRARKSSALVSMAREFGEAVSQDHGGDKMAKKAITTLSSLVSGRPSKEQRLIAYFFIRELFRHGQSKVAIGLADYLVLIHLPVENIKLHSRLQRWRREAVIKILGKGAGL